jgi:hypothetical protein
LRRTGKSFSSSNVVKSTHIEESQSPLFSVTGARIRGEDEEDGGEEHEEEEEEESELDEGGEEEEAEEELDEGGEEAVEEEVDEGEEEVEDAVGSPQSSGRLILRAGKK